MAFANRQRQETERRREKKLSSAGSAQAGDRGKGIDRVGNGRFGSGRTQRLYWTESA